MVCVYIDRIAVTEGWRFSWTPLLEVIALFGPFDERRPADGKEYGVARVRQHALEPGWALCAPLAKITKENDVIPLQLQGFALDENNDNEKGDEKLDISNVGPNDEKVVLDLELDISQSPCVIRYKESRAVAGACGAPLETRGNGTAGFPDGSINYRITVE